LVGLWDSHQHFNIGEKTMPQHYLLDEPFSDRQVPSFLAGQGRTQGPITGRNINLANVSKQPAEPLPASAFPPVTSAISPTAAAPAAPPAQRDPNWWQNLGAGGQSAFLRAALAMGSSMLERTDPHATNPFTALSSGLLTGLDVHEEIKEKQREEKLRSRLADISIEQPSAAFAGEVGRTLAGAGEVGGAISAFEAQQRLTPETTKPQIFSSGGRSYLYDFGTGRIDPLTEREPSEFTLRRGETRIRDGKVVAEGGAIPEQLYNVDGRLYRYDTVAQKAIPLTEKELKDFTLPRGAKRIRETPEGAFETVAKGEPIPAGGEKAIDKEVRESNLRKRAEDIVRKRFGAPPQEFTGFGIRDKNYAKKLKKYREDTSELREKLEKQFGLAPVEITEEGIEIPPELQEDFNIMKNNPANKGATDQEILDSLIGR
jgi:hypothetical protein